MSTTQACHETVSPIAGADPREVAHRVTLVAVVSLRDGLALVDRDGHMLARGVRQDRLGPMTAEAIFNWTWRDVVARMAKSVNARASSRRVDAWQRRADSLSKSFSLRGRDLEYRGGRRAFDRYRTTTWSEAANRLVEQGRNRLRVCSRSGWERWAYTVSNNQKKRAVAYERRKNHGKTGA